MKKNFTPALLSFVALLVLTLALMGCIDYEQKGKLNADGSGVASVHYWTKSSNVMFLTSSALKFDEASVRQQYAGGGVTIKGDIKIEENQVDSTKHVHVELEFADINNVKNAPAFANTPVSYEKKGDNMFFTQTLKLDTNATKLGMDAYSISYAWEFPGNVIDHNAQKVEGKAYAWNYKLSDLSKDIDMKVVLAGVSGGPSGGDTGGGSSTTIIIIVAAVVVVLIAVILMMRKKPAAGGGAPTA
jgi:hypothetical protein